MDHHTPLFSSLRYDIKDEAQLAMYIMEQTRAISKDLQKNRQEGYLGSFVRKGDGLEAILLKSQHEESTRTFAKALMQNCLLDKDKAATVASKWGSISSLLEAYADPTKSEKDKKSLLVGTKVSGNDRALGLISSTAVYSLLSRKDPNERIDRVKE